MSNNFYDEIFIKEQNYFKGSNLEPFEDYLEKIKNTKIPKGLK